ncbi:DUF3693 domain-containing protein [Vibrio antiquarius]|uniref:DUF3693 domain-containing protein n=1 Tax=Vibrio antiquarius (strain Ex25) TaxID=150340 RepID=UPI00265B0778|nr:DUF3693 domain-containing protein [Vibrio antiquarius]MCR9915313.1 DUF3693 domain-containing protein [Vibrio antiquarius]
MNQSSRNNNPQIKAVWEGIEKKYNGLGLSSISMVCGMFALWLGDLKVAIAKCVLYVLC